ncbi:MAG: ATP-binding protein [Pyrinomonadaceae bacterium]
MRLTLWYAGVLALVLILFAVLTYLLINYTLQNQTNRTLKEIAEVFETTAKSELEDEDKITDIVNTDEAVRDATVELGFRNYQVMVFSPDKNLIAGTKIPNGANQISLQTAQKQIENHSSGAPSGFSDFEIDGEAFRLFFYPFSLANKNYRLVVFHSLNDQNEIMLRVQYAFFISVPLALLIAGFGGFFLAKKSLAPISQMSRKAEAITAKNLHERLPVKNERNELGLLASKFNELLSRLDASFEQQRRFMADASHELRTPVAIVRGEAEVILRKERREEAEYRESFSIVQSEAERMTRIIGDLFTLARADIGQQPLQKENLYLDEVLSEAIKAFRTVARKRNVGIECKISDEMIFSGDAQLLGRLFSNLLDNALKHARSSVKVSAEKRGNSYFIDISDDGEGISESHQPHIFERFYRADKARSRQENAIVGSGAGLGLSISKFIAESHGGNLCLSKSDPSGSIFSVRFPA